MELDEQLRQVADRVSPPPPGDPSAVIRRGVRRRRWRHAVHAVAVVVLIGLLGTGLALMDRPPRPDIVNQPPGAAPSAHNGGHQTGPAAGPVITGPPEVIVSSTEPFPWAAAVSPGQERRWCLTVILGSTGIPVERQDQPCDQPVDPGQIAGWGESAPHASGQRLAWGFVPPETDSVVVEFTDDARRGAQLNPSDVGDAKFWAIGYESGTVEAVEAIHGGQVIAGGTVLDGFDVGDVVRLSGWVAGIVLLLAVASWFVRRRRG